MNLFAYGTLMWPEIMSDVIGRKVQGCPARLDDARRLRVRGEVYPSVIVAQSAQAEGVLYTGLTDAEIAALDRFEGVEYVRRTVAVETADGPVTAEVYFASEAGLGLLETTEWHPDHLSSVMLDSFRKTYKGWV